MSDWNSWNDVLPKRIKPKVCDHGTPIAQACGQCQAAPPRYVTDAEAAKVRPFELWESKTPNDLFTERLLATRRALLEALITEHALRVEQNSGAVKIQHGHTCDTCKEPPCAICVLAAHIRGEKC